MYFFIKDCYDEKANYSQKVLSMSWKNKKDAINFLESSHDEGILYLINERGVFKIQEF